MALSELDINGCETFQFYVCPWMPPVFTGSNVDNLKGCFYAAIGCETLCPT